MREFRTAVKAKKDADQPIPFTLDGQQYLAVKPKDWALLETAAAQADGVGEAEQAAAAVGFIKAVFAEPGRSRLLARLRDPADDIDVADVRPIMEWLTEEWSGRPTG